MTEYFASPTGLPANPGSESDPLDLATAVGSASPVHPGDTLYLLGGVYKGTFTSVLTGVDGSRITVKPAPGEKPVVDGSLQFKGAWTDVRDGIEFTNSEPDRSLPRPDGVDMFGPNTRLINCVIHGCGQGVGCWSPAVNAEVYGCIIYDNWSLDAVGNRHGHGIYTQNEAGSIKHISENVVWDCHDFGLHAYGQQGQLIGFRFTGNVTWGVTFLVGGTTYPVSDLVCQENHIYQTILEIGYHAKGNALGSILNNVFAEGVLQMVNWSDLTVHNNLFMNLTPSDIIIYALNPNPTDPNDPANAPVGFQWSGNTYITPKTKPFGTNGIAPYWSTLAQWQQFIQSDYDSVHQVQAASGKQVYLRPNAYDGDRAHIIAYDWGATGSVEADPSPVLAVGDGYTVYNVQDLNTPVAIGVYDGSAIILPMVGTPTSPTFNAFVLVRTQFQDTMPPEIYMPYSVTAEATGPNGAAVTWTAKATDLVDGDVSSTLAYSPNMPPGSVFPLGTTTLTVTAHDKAGNVASATLTVKVVDTTPPTITITSP